MNRNSYVEQNLELNIMSNIFGQNVAVFTAFMIWDWSKFDRPPPSRLEKIEKIVW